MSGTLAIIGAGAKAVAVAAKAAVLREMGVEVADVIAIERTGVAANWKAGGGWTDGRQRLGTSPEKDVGFPYRSNLVPGRNAELDERMMRFSWQSYLVATDQFVGWIDRGRPAPTHDTWAGYLRWVAEVVDLKVVRGEVVQISVDGSRWCTAHAGDCARGRRGYGDGYRPGTSRSGPCCRAIRESDVDLPVFWERAGQHDRIVANENVAVIGGGETAASILNELHRRVSAITAISPQATLFTRGEGFFENSLFSDSHRLAQPDAGRTSRLHRPHRPRGGSPRAFQESLLADERIKHLRGRVARGGRGRQPNLDHAVYRQLRRAAGNPASLRPRRRAGPALIRCGSCRC